MNDGRVDVGARIEHRVEGTEEEVSLLGRGSHEQSAERRTERQLIRDYRALIEEVAARLDHDTHALAVALASVPEKIRGYGHVKEAHLADAKAQEAELLEAFRNPQAAKSAAE